MNTLIRWTARSWSQSTTRTALSRVHTIQAFSSSCPPLLITFSKDPVKRAQQLENARSWKAKQYRKNEEYRNQALARGRRWVERVRADPALAMASKAYKASHWQQRMQSEQFRGTDGFKQWVTYRLKKGVANMYVWKTHVPILYNDKVKHTCVGCGYPVRNGLKLWWQEIFNPSLYKCHQCYCSPDVSKVMPVGYEDVQLGRRKTTKSHTCIAGSHSSPCPSTAESDTHREKEQAQDEKKSS